MAKPDPVESARRQAYLLVLPLGAIVALIAGSFGLLTGRGTSTGAWIGIGAAGVLAAFAYAVALRRMSLVRLERALVTFAVGVMGIAIVVVGVRTGTQGQLTELTRQAFWLPAVFAFTFLGFGPRNGAWISAGLWALAGAVTAVHLLPGHAHPVADVTLLVEVLLVDGVVLTLFAGIARVLQTSQRVARSAQLEATTDPLTGLANRRFGERMLEDEVERAQRYGRPLSVVLFDVDLFKQVNDTYGHAVGDAVLRCVPEVFEANHRESDRLVRWGGEEFLLIAPELALEDASRLGERMRGVVERHAFPVGRRLTASFGVATRGPEETAADVVRRADQAMYAAKRAGRNAAFRSTGSDGEAIVEPIGAGDPTRSDDVWPAVAGLTVDPAGAAASEPTPMDDDVS